MKEFCCGDVVPGCTSTFRAATEEQVLMQVAAHAKEAHGMASVPPEIVAQVRQRIRDAA